MMNKSTSFDLFDFDLSSYGVDTPCSVEDVEPLPLHAKVGSLALLDALLLPSSPQLEEHPPTALPSHKSSSVAPSVPSSLSYSSASAPTSSNTNLAAQLAALDSDDFDKCLDKTPLLDAFNLQAIGRLSSQLQHQQEQLSLLIRGLADDSTSCGNPTAVLSINDCDIVCARGKFMYNHPGCVRFRHIVRASTPQYQAALTRMEKSQVIDQIICTVLSDNEDVRFVKLDSISGSWRVLSRQQIRDKVGHALRESIHEQGRRLKSRQVRSLGTWVCA